MAPIILSIQHICGDYSSSLSIKFLPTVFSFSVRKIFCCVQFKMVSSSKVNLCIGNGSLPWYLPILHEGGDWPRAIAKLVAHFRRPSQGENYVPNNKDSRCCSRINKTGQMAAFALFWGNVTPIKFYKCSNGSPDIVP